MQLEDLRMSAGLVHAHGSGLSIAEATQAVTGALHTFGVRVSGQRSGPDNRATVQTRDRLIHLMAGPHPRTDARVLHVCVEDRAADVTGPAADVLLVEITTRLHAALRPDLVIWRDAAILSSAEFQGILRAAENDMKDAPECTEKQVKISTDHIPAPTEARRAPPRQGLRVRLVTPLPWEIANIFAEIPPSNAANAAERHDGFDPAWAGGRPARVAMRRAG